MQTNPSTHTRLDRDKHVLRRLGKPTYGDIENVVEGLKTKDALRHYLLNHFPNLTEVRDVDVPAIAPSAILCNKLKYFGMLEQGFLHHVDPYRIPRELQANPDIARALNIPLAQPPKGVHSMQRGNDWIGDIYSADLTISCLARCGIHIKAGDKILDYGCSSGPLLRVLGSTHEHTHFVGTDPVATSIDWARENITLKNTEWRIQDQAPPLPIESNSINGIVSISVFSHHGYEAAKYWLEELHRVLTPGGFLIFTAHGIGSLCHYLSEHHQTPLNRFQALAVCLLHDGYVFEEPWVETDDVGNISTAALWGNSFYAPETILDMNEGLFSYAKIFIRANQQNQDVYVLRKTSN